MRKYLASDAPSQVFSNPTLLVFRTHLKVSSALGCRPHTFSEGLHRLRLLLSDHSEFAPSCQRLSGNAIQMVEAAGVEPASLTNVPAATTCLVRSKFSSGQLRPDTESPSLARMQEFQPFARGLRA